MSVLLPFVEQQNRTEGSWLAKMTRLSRDFGYTVQKEAILAVSSDVALASSRFPNVKVGANNQIVDGKDDTKVLSSS